MDGLLQALERSGGYAALNGLILVGVFWLARHQIGEQTKRSREREVEATAHHADEIRRVIEFLDREGQNAADHRNDKTQLIAIVQADTEAKTALAELVRTSIEMQRQTNERLIELDKYLMLQQAARKEELS